ncbi:hypothetical protein CLAFUW4_08977 [Fulvia fulva]|nr:hypothetical protein CLAFUR4_08983 [Fulvia fulva]KAK4614334.1 hypothetical protein CLAFUR0_08975 [Fulvia fulva]WPV20158.1 hypothetical protein CLAFUW4_08977 [Fulvia fulva]WPV35220.1 hypothetical protein CLAFUW7_08978 [Fulvia fulva]
MDTSDAAERVAEKVRDLLTRNLREEFPCLKTEALEKLVKDSGNLVKSRVQEQAPIMAASKAHMSFMSLPPELRNNIYEIVLLHPGGLDIQPVTMVRGNRMRKFKPEVPTSRVPDIARVPRQIRQEVLSLHYGLNTFSVHVDSRNIKAPHHSRGMPRESIAAKAHKWLQHIGPQSAALIRDLAIVIPLSMDECTCRGKCIRGGRCRAWHLPGPEGVARLLKLHRYGVPLSSIAVQVGPLVEVDGEKILWQEAVKALGPI